MQRISLLSILTILGSLLFPAAGQTHCEIPCGIYDDSTRFDLLAEHITTIEKSMTQIRELSAAPDQNANQLIRWVANKEDHANKFQEIVSQYFLTQRLQPIESDAEGYAAYQEQLELAHRLIVSAMKCKQTIDQTHIDNLRATLERFRTAYWTAHGHSH